MTVSCYDVSILLDIRLTQQNIDLSINEEQATVVLQAWPSWYTISRIMKQHYIKVDAMYSWRNIFVGYVQGLPHLDLKLLLLALM